MKVTMRHKISGQRDGADWPDPGETIDVPDDEAVMLLAQGMAVEAPAAGEVGPGETAAAKKR